MLTLDNTSSVTGSSNQGPNTFLNNNTQDYSSDSLMWRAQFDGIGKVLQKDENISQLQGGESVIIYNSICPYDNNLEENFIAFYNIFYTRFQVWAISKGLLYSQNIMDNGVIQMTFSKITY